MYIKTVGIQLFYLGRKELVEQFVIALEHFLIDFRREFLVESPIFQGFQYFIIATPHRQGSMIAKTANVVAGFCFYSFQEGWIGRIGSAGKHKVLPYQYSVFICQVIETVVFVGSASPHTNDIHVGFFDVPK